jgi:hypothetical protein
MWQLKLTPEYYSSKIIKMLTDFQWEINPNVK